MEAKIKLEAIYHPNDSSLKWELRYGDAFRSRWFETKEGLLNYVNEYGLPLSEKTILNTKGEQ